MSAKVGIEPRGNVDGGRLAGGVLHHEEQLCHDLDDVAGLEDKVALALDGLGGQAAGDVRLAPQLSRRGGLNMHNNRGLIKGDSLAIMINSKEPSHMDGYVFLKIYLTWSVLSVCVQLVNNFLKYLSAMLFLYAFYVSLPGLLFLESYEKPSPMIGRNSSFIECNKNAPNLLVSIIFQDYRLTSVCIFRAKIVTLRSTKRVQERIFRIST